MKKTLGKKIKDKLKKWLLPPAPEKLLIEETVINNIQEFAKSSYPNEFIAFLHGEIKKINKKYVAIVDGLDIINYHAGKNSTTFNRYDLPMLSGTIGTVHSHPGIAIPSKADLRTFRKMGWIHLIIGHPFSKDDIRCFNKKGEYFPFSIINTYHKDE